MGGGAIGSAIGTLYGSHPPRGLVYFLSIGSFILGLLWFYRAYSKPFDVRRFQLRDLFRNTETLRHIGGPTKTQLWIEGLFFLTGSVLLLLIFRTSN